MWVVEALTADALIQPAPGPSAPPLDALAQTRWDGSAHEPSGLGISARATPCNLEAPRDQNRPCWLPDSIVGLLGIVRS